MLSYNHVIGKVQFNNKRNVYGNEDGRQVKIRSSKRKDITMEAGNVKRTLIGAKQFFGTPLSYAKIFSPKVLSKMLGLTFLHSIFWY